MTYRVVIHKSVEKFLDSHHDIAKQFIEKVALLAQDPYSRAIDTKPLQ